MPFDQTEAEEEIIAGYNTEYSGIRFGLLYFQEYIVMLLGSILLVHLYLGGWNGPVIPVISFISPMIWFFMKLVIVLVALIWIRVSLPRFRIDQVTDLGWKILLPLSMVNLGWAVAVGLYFA
jgi:NADH-quinone oxidoreductase subunit H